MYFYKKKLIYNPGFVIMVEEKKLLIEIYWTVTEIP